MVSTRKQPKEEAAPEAAAVRPGRGAEVHFCLVGGVGVDHEEPQAERPAAGR